MLTCLCGMSSQSQRSVQEGVGDYGSLLGGIIQLAVTPLGKAKAHQSVPRPSRNEVPARPHLSH